MRNLIVCLDGTWNTPDQLDRGRQVPSNVVKMARAVKEGRVSASLTQKVYYDTGVGTGGWLDKVIGGATGRGIMKNIMQAYAWLVETYEDGGQIYIFSFSRGAYTARSLAGLVGVCGIASPEDDGGPSNSLLSSVVDIYRIKNSEQRTAAAKTFREQHTSRSNEIHFVGVWDTVGALGVPTSGPLGWWTRRRSGFHDVKLGKHIKHARHAIAINERRGPFQPTLWTPDELAEGQTLVQAWFPGVHSNVGGGYVDTGLSDRALLWMINAAYERGLKFDGNYVDKRIEPNWFGELRKSTNWKYHAMFWNRPKHRSIGTEHADTEYLHPSADGRWGHASKPEEPPENYNKAKKANVPTGGASDYEMGFND